MWLKLDIHPCSPSNTLPVKVELFVDVTLPTGETDSTRIGCDGFAEKPLREIPAGGIGKWTDENGIIHYEDYQGDHSPEGLKVVTRFADTKDYFSRYQSGIGRPADEFPFQRQSKSSLDLRILSFFTG